MLIQFANSHPVEPLLAACLAHYDKSGTLQTTYEELSQKRC